jgi:hypothetical protein
VLRASAVAEAAGVPSVSLVCEGFMGQAATTSVGLGMPNLPLAMVPGHVDVQSAEELKANITLERVINGLTAAPAEVASLGAEPDPREIAFTGSFEEVNRLFYENEWSDGLPIVPPTIAKVEEFIRYAGRVPDEVLGIAPPDNRKATVWSVAVNGVMAGCRPEYMPVLLAAVEAILDSSCGECGCVQDTTWRLPQSGSRWVAERQFIGGSNQPEVDNHENLGNCRGRVDRPVRSQLHGTAS